ncbi:zinc finger CCCH-type antiviral protein 1-like isoform X2 [Cyprinodon tularosa]|uniref:zinc finger CCCH-type antiviral protein 1-like isoform X2 n=1 Tax=Cyprinodon tularosa TaxID=77115 RepID=UPI0018E1E227|nr:zinc finger CCCH-type antiviral protein 1-like isoform X2 [Cyprinodon tularosa]
MVSPLFLLIHAFKCQNPCFSVSGNNYLWQLMVGGQWLKIENDHVIETHYCQPGAKGITINTSIGAALKVRRLSFVPQGQAEDIAWYYRDDDLWCEYGSQSSNMSSTSIHSKDIEMHFSQNPRGTIQFTIGLTTYSLDFYTMTQINLATGSCRDVRRRPKFTLNDVGAVQLGSALQMLSLGSQPQWQFEGHSGAWYKFKHRYGTLTECSLNSNEIERKYQQNPTDCITFTVNGYPYKLDFASMIQINQTTNYTRRIRRMLV